VSEDQSTKVRKQHSESEVKFKLLAMDQPPLPLHGGRPRGLAIAPTTYVTYYRHREDLLQGDYGTWVAAYAVGNANIPASVRETMLNTSDTVPRVFMTMGPSPNGTPVVKTLFHPQL
jgi:hypothetical protein